MASEALIRLAQVNGLVDADAKVPHVACRDIGRVALAAALLGPPADGKRYLPAFTDYVSGEDLCQLLGKAPKALAYSNPPDFVLRIFSHESLLMKHDFNKLGRPPFRDAPETVAQMHECRKLLGGDFWTMETWLKENGYDKRLKPAPAPVWIKAVAAVAVLGAAVAFYLWRR